MEEGGDASGEQELKGLMWPFAPRLVALRATPELLSQSL